MEKIQIRDGKIRIRNTGMLDPDADPLWIYRKNCREGGVRCAAVFRDENERVLPQVQAAHAQVCYGYRLPLF